MVALTEYVAVLVSEALSSMPAVTDADAKIAPASTVVERDMEPETVEEVPTSIVRFAPGEPGNRYDPGAYARFTLVTERSGTPPLHRPYGETTSDSDSGVRLRWQKTGQ